VTLDHVFKKGVGLYTPRTEETFIISRSIHFFSKLKMKLNDVRQILFEIMMILYPIFRENALLCNIYELENVIHIKMLLLPIFPQ